jgi:hypothetical protein
MRNGGDAFTEDHIEHERHYAHQKNMFNNETTSFSSGGAYRRVLMKRDGTSRRAPKRVRTSWRMVETHEARPRT